MAVEVAHPCKIAGALCFTSALVCQDAHRLCEDAGRLIAEARATQERARDVRAGCLAAYGAVNGYLAGDERGARPTRMRGARSVECVDPEGTPLVNGVDHVVLKFYPDVLGLTRCPREPPFRLAEGRRLDRARDGRARRQVKGAPHPLAARAEGR